MTSRKICGRTYLMIYGYVLVLFLALISSVFSQSVPPVIHISAAASLKNAVQEISKSYPSAQLISNFDSSSVLATQIKAGAPADLFISADEAKMDGLEKEGLLFPNTRQDLLLNSLVVVGYEKSDTLASLADLANDPKKKIAIGQPDTVPAGIYAKVVLTNVGLWDKVQPQLVPCQNVRAALAAVESGDAQFAIVYKSDTKIMKQSHVAYAIPEAMTPRIVYPVALVKSPDAKDPSPSVIAFENYLFTPDAKAIFEKYGFTVAPASPGK